MTDAWQQALEEFLRPRLILVGIGNRLRGDDAFGPILVDRLRGRISSPLFDAAETPENYIGRIASLEPERILILDAVRWGASPGCIGFFPTDAIPFGGVSTHAVSLRLFAELTASRAECPVALLGAEPKGTAMGDPLSPEVGTSIDRLAQYLVRAAEKGECESASA